MADYLFSREGATLEELFDKIERIPEYAPMSNYKRRVLELIRERYTEGDEFQILREKIAGKLGAAEAFSEYNSYVEWCMHEASMEQ